MAHRPHDLEAGGGGCCGCAGAVDPVRDPRVRTVLLFCLWANGAMFAVEVLAGVSAGSASLLADALDFAGDAAGYGLSLWALAQSARWSARVALFKGQVMLVYALGVILWSAWIQMSGTVPEPATMGVVGLIALLVNMLCALLLFRYRSDNANMRSVWLCSRNDALGNLAIMVAAAGVFGLGTAWPDLAVALFMAALATRSGLTVIREARTELERLPAAA